MKPSCVADTLITNIPENGTACPLDSRGWNIQVLIDSMVAAKMIGLPRDGAYASDHPFFVGFQS